MLLIKRLVYLKSIEPRWVIWQSREWLLIVVSTQYIRLCYRYICKFPTKSFFLFSLFLKVSFFFSLFLYHILQFLSSQLNLLLTLFFLANDNGDLSGEISSRIKFHMETFSKIYDAIYSPKSLAALKEIFNMYCLFLRIFFGFSINCFLFLFLLICIFFN